MVEVAGVISNFIYMGGYQWSQSVVLLDVYRKYRLGSLPKSFQGLNILFAVYGNADDVGPGLLKNLDLPSRGIDIHSPGSGHALYGYRRIAPNSQGADTDFSGFARLDWGIHSWILSLKGWCRIDK